MATPRPAARTNETSLNAPPRTAQGRRGRPVAHQSDAYPHTRRSDTSPDVPLATECFDLWNPLINVPVICRPTLNATGTPRFRGTRPSPTQSRPL